MSHIVDNPVFRAANFEHPSIMTQIDLFQSDFSGEHFEKHSKENGYTYWYASFLKVALGYESQKSFDKAIGRAMATCTTLSIPIIENFTPVEREENGQKISDMKLSRFACYLVVMNADVKKIAVAKAQAYFATLAGAVHDYIEESSKLDRIVTRDELSEGEKSLSGVAKQAGVENYAFFRNAGYRGMYNRNLQDLKSMRKLPSDRTPLDFMGREELAANLFRITQTESRIKNENIQGQKRLENAAENVGKEVRDFMIRNSGVRPEDLPVKEDIKNVRKELKEKSRTIKSIDKKNNKKPK